MKKNLETNDRYLARAAGKRLSPMACMSAILDYIGVHEEEDFYDNPSTTHVYYYYLVVTEGEITAQNEYQMALQEHT